MQKQRGRPQIPKEKRVTKKVTVLLTDEEKEYLTKAAKVPITLHPDTSAVWDRTV